MKKQTSKNIFYIGLLSFFGGISQDMFVPILPLYLSNVLLFDKAFIGISEGLVTAGSSLFKIVAGYLTDKYGKTKPFIFLGYLFSFIARPLLAIFTTAGAVMSLRFLDGIGKGLKDTPKDALISVSTKFENRGRGFGIVRMLDTFGSVVGPLLLFGLLYVFQNNFLKYHYILLLTTIPLCVTLLLVNFKLTEMGVKKGNKNVLKISLPKPFYIFLFISLLFSFGNASDAFLILRAQNIGVTLLAIPLVYALFNFVYAAASVPLGSLSDKIGRVRVILLGWLAYTLAYLGFGYATATYQVWLLFAFYGLYYATTYGVAKAFIADMVSVDHRGRAYGIYNTAISLVALPANFIVGYLWDTYTPAAPFYYGATLSFTASLLLLLFFLFKKNIVYKQS